MRWWLIPLLAVVAWFAYTLTPFWSLYGFAAAVQAGDAAAVEQRVNFRTLRLSLARQISAAVKADSNALDPRERQRIADAAAAVALPIMESALTPKAVIDLLDDGWPQGADLAAPAGRHERRDGLRIPDLKRLLRYYLAADMRGFRSVLVAVPPDRPRHEQFRIRLRLRDWGWRLVDIELSDDLRRRIGEKAAAAAARLRDGRTNPDKTGPDASPHREP
ncbi:hypothetical protein MEX01_27260 [Methylorubrum extorquens]|uniref:DUF2939 domain-containing protein n=1 Tax=Methylorubrum extorquens TaxID=408 RepID=UPI00116888DF|nr:DUF2939 domain-containing protein [Methylorubrum extorquens]GEL42135.1 hypothetical protein MEX01_27260 [Methylorubrum extorquens]